MRAGLRPHRGWAVVAGAFLVMMVGYGAIYSYSAFVDDIVGEFGATRGRVSLIFGLSGGTALLVSAVSGTLADRLGARLIAGLGMCLVGVGLLVAAAAQSIEEVIAGYGLVIGLGVGFAYVPAVATVQRWFVTYRGLASGVAVSGIGVGTALVPHLAEFLTSYGNWRLAFVICACAAAVVGVAGALLLEQSPEAIGMGPDGRRRRRAARPAEASGAVAGPTLCSAAFGRIYAGTMLLSVPVAIPYALLVETAQAMGEPWQACLALLGLIGIGSVAGRFLLAAIGDGLGRARVFLACSTLLALSMLLWGSATSLAQLQAFALIFGVLQGAFVALLPSIVTDRFGAGLAGTLIGVLYTSRAVGLFAGPAAVTLAMTWTGSRGVTLALVAALGMTGVSLIAGSVRRRAAAGGAVPARVVPATKVGLALGTLAVIAAAGPEF